MYSHLLPLVDAWDYLYLLWSRPFYYSPYGQVAVIIPRRYGMISTSVRDSIFGLADSKLITEAVKQKMLKAVAETEKSGRKWPSTKAGARRRAAFCLRQARAALAAAEARFYKRVSK